MTQQLKELAEQMLKLQQVVKMLSDNVTDIHQVVKIHRDNIADINRRADIDIRVLNDAVADLNDHVEKRERLLNDLCDDVMKLKAHADRPSDYMRRVKEADKLCAKVWSPEELAEDMKKRRV